MKFNEIRNSQSLRVGRIRYMNSDPVYYSLENTKGDAPFELFKGAPSTLNEMVRKGQLDISPVSSVEYARNHDKYFILPDLSISSFGPVRSVFLMTQKPKNELFGQRIWVTDESETSLELLRILFREEFGFYPKTVSAAINSEFLKTRRPTAALVIGDQALHAGLRNGFKYRYDLAEWWREQTGLGFVFALWVVRREVARAYPALVQEALQSLIQSKHETRAILDVVAQAAGRRSGLDKNVVLRYLDNLVFDLSTPFVEGLSAFYAKLSNQRIIQGEVPLRFFKYEHASTLTGDGRSVPVAAA